MVEPFVLSGKAKNVFRLIELKAKREQELELLLRTHSCPYSPTATCNKTDDMTCAQMRCKVWEEIDGE